MISKSAAARQAAGRLTTKHVTAVAAQYLAWIEAQTDEQQAVEALLVSSTRSKKPDAVLVAAAQAYAEMPNEPDAVGAGLGVYKPQGWGSHWRAALASQGLARLAAVGDSVMRGYFASNLDTKGYVGLLRSTLQAAHGDGGSGFKGVIDTVTMSSASHAANYFTQSGQWDASQKKNGPGGIAIQPGPAGAYIQATVRGSIVEIFVVDRSPYIGFTYSIDGAPGVIHPSSGANGIMHVTVSGLTAGNHLVRVTSHAGATFVAGISGRNTAGVVVDNYSVQGSNAGHWNNLDESSATTNVIDGGAGAWSGGYRRPADLILLGSILNNASAGADPAQYTQHLKRYLDGVRGRTSGAPTALDQHGGQDIAIVLPHAGHFDNATNSRYLQMATEARDIAEAYGAALVNFWALGRNSWDYWHDLGYWSDGSTASGLPGADSGHPSDAGHQHMHDVLIDVLPELLG